MTRNNHYAKEALVLPGSFDLPTSSYLSMHTSKRIREEFYQLKYESHIFYTFWAFKSIPGFRTNMSAPAPAPAPAPTYLVTMPSQPRVAAVAPAVSPMSYVTTSSVNTCAIPQNIVRTMGFQK